MAAGSVPVYISDKRLIVENQRKFISRQGLLIGGLFLLAAIGTLALALIAWASGGHANIPLALGAAAVLSCVSIIGFGLRNEVVLDGDSRSLTVYRGFYSLRLAQSFAMATPSEIVIKATPSGPGRYQLLVAQATGDPVPICSCATQAIAEDWAKDLTTLLGYSSQK